MSTALLVKALTPPEGWVPSRLTGAVPAGRHYEPVNEELTSIFMASEWAYEQMGHYGSIAQLGVNQGRHHDEDEIRILVLLMNHFSNAWTYLKETFRSETNFTAVVVRYVAEKLEVTISVEF